MGALAELGADEADDGTFVGEGAAFVEWWRTTADEADRALVRRWVDTPPRKPGHKSYSDIAAALHASGARVSAHTIAKGVKALRRLHEWEA